MILKVNNLKVRAGVKDILKGVDLIIGSGEVHVVMGPNGSGKSTLAQVIAGHPFYKINSGTISVNGKIINKLTADKRAKLGLFLGFQNPIEIPGVSVFNVIRKAKIGIDAKNIGQFRKDLVSFAEGLKLSADHLSRSFNEGFSGGEKKRNEILQLLALSPKFVILDEIDSGLDVDGLKIVAEAIAKFHKKNPKSSVILITHYARILKYLKADFVHVMTDGKIIKSGKQKLATEIEEKGYESYKKGLYA